ncbi:hypothetical protein FT663_01636 [Candidozyma haemuli var. vulneris]|nr:hypothetical protein FT662_04152 [[Candida] haemuloni var. vulneris]KAF3993926.1 hypothetical protein FT663_01636 [[Candida] haemuloni var. vulneris]
MLIPKSTAQGDRSSEYSDFLRLQAIAARDKEFLNSHTEDWYHGISPPYSLVKYTPFEQFNKAHFGRAMNSEVYMNPHVQMEKVALPHPDTRSSSLDESSKRSEGSSEYAENFKRDWDASSFSGYFQLPNFSYSRQQPGKDMSEGIGQFCYQTHFDVDNLTVMFGGLFVDASQSLKSLGIPRSTDLSRISVHFPCELPPHINKHVLMSPCVMQNRDLILFDAMKGTVQASLISKCSDIHPGNLCSMVGTVIADSYVFFSGGFQIIVDKVEYKEEINRWLVYKSIRLNEHGYILNVRTKQFTQIKIKSNSDVHYEGAIGNAMVSNKLERASLRSNQLASPDIPASYHSDTSQNATPTAEEILSSTNSPGASTPLTRSPEKPPLREPQPSKQVHSSAASSDSRPRAVSSQSSVSTARATTPTSSRNVSRSNTDYSRQLNKPAKQGESRASGSAISPTNSASEGSSKMTSMLMKSARIFHRNHHNHAFGHGQSPQSSSGSSAQTQSQNLASLRANSPSPNPIPHGNYADQVKHHRSQPSSSGTSAGSTSPGRHMTHSPVHTQSVPPTESIDSVSEEGSSLSVPQEGVEKLKLNSGIHGTGLPKATERTLSPDDTNSLGSGSTGEGLFAAKDSAMESGVLSVTVFLFGGFVKDVSEDDKMRFKATNDLLRLELIIEDGQLGNFHKEALIFDATDRNEHSVWPSRRGFFAYVLVNNDSSSEFCPFQATNFELVADEPSKSHIFSSENTQEIVSASENSTESSTRGSDLLLKRRGLLIQGGVNEANGVCSDIYIFNFSTSKWHKQQSYAYDYYNLPKQPFEDEQCEKLTLENTSSNPPLVDAELRACHHHALLYEQDSREYVLFVGGFNNDFLRHYDPEPYVSDRYDVSRLSRFSITTTNPNLLRVPALNLRTQTWVFMRFFFDLRESITSRAMDTLMGNPNFRNSRMALYGGGCSITGKQITMCHGMVQFVSEKAEDFDKYKEELKSNVFMTGCHCHLSYPSM